MKTKQTYSVEFREQALAKALQRGNRSVGAVASELNMSVLTLRKWIRVSNAASRNPVPVDARRPEDWSLEERLLALHQSHGLTDEALHAWCRERGRSPIISPSGARTSARPAAARPGARTPWKYVN